MPQTRFNNSLDRLQKNKKFSVKEEMMKPLFEFCKEWENCENKDSRDSFEKKMIEGKNLELLKKRERKKQEGFYFQFKNLSRFSYMKSLKISSAICSQGTFL